MSEVAAEAVELPDDEHVTLPQGAQAAVEPRPVVAYAGGEVVVLVDRVDALGSQGVALQVQRLGAVGLRDAGVADQHVSQTVVWDMGALATGTPGHQAGVESDQIARPRLDVVTAGRCAAARVSTPWADAPSTPEAGGSDRSESRYRGICLASRS